MDAWFFSQFAFVNLLANSVTTSLFAEIKTAIISSEDTCSYEWKEKSIEANVEKHKLHQ